MLRLAYTARMSNALRTPFYDYHQSHDAKFVDFAGWDMPVHYGSIIDEHQYTRQTASLFDVSHMGRIEIKGRGARKLLERTLTRRITDMEVKQCRYSLICNEQGGVMDDVIVYRFDDHWLLVVNAINRQKIYDHLLAVQKAEDYVANIKDVTQDTAMVAVQGPKVMDIIGKFSKEVPTLGKYRFTVKNMLVLKMTISRTGYTGEDGVEVILGAKMASMAIKLLLKEGDDGLAIKPAGLGARDTLRIEAGMPLYGHELDEETNPLEAGLDFAVSLDKDTIDSDGPPVPRFIGQDALQAIADTGPSKKLVMLKLEGKRSPRQGMEVMKDGQVIGHVTSGCLSPTLGHPIALAYLNADATEIDDAVNIMIGDTPISATISHQPALT